MEAEKGESGGVDEGSDTEAGEEDADEDEDEESKHFFCGLDWGTVSNNCDGSQPCPTGTNEECVMLGAQCFGGTTCDSSKGDGEYFEFFGLPYEDARNRLFCASTWAEAESSCSIDLWCKGGLCPEGTTGTCLQIDCNIQDLIKAELGADVGSGGGESASKVVLGIDDPKRHNFCGRDWGDASNQCGDWCPEGTECEQGQSCFADTTCYYDRDIVPSATPTVTYDKPENLSFCGTGWSDAMQCTVERHCPNGDSDCPSSETCYNYLPGCNIVDLLKDQGPEPALSMSPTRQPTNRPFTPAPVEPDNTPSPTPGPTRWIMAWIDVDENEQKEDVEPDDKSIPTYAPTITPVPVKPDSTYIPTYSPTRPETEWVDNDENDENEDLVGPEVDANPGRFFCGTSSLNAKRICEACPSRRTLECSNPSHICFAGITGCSISGTPPSMASSTQSNTSPPSTARPTALPQQMSQLPLPPPPTEQPTRRPVDPPAPQPSRPPSRQPSSFPTRRPTRPPVEVETTNDSISIYGRCSSNLDCQAGQLCNEPDSRQGGYCGECLSDGTGCTTEEQCRTAGCTTQQYPGETKCYSREELDQDCAIRLSDIGAKCNAYLMSCEIQKQTIPAPPTDADGEAASADTTMYENPDGNEYFCGYSFATVTQNCLQSMPCPGGYSSVFCAKNEGCFIAPSCAALYEEASTIAGRPSPPRSTHRPTRNPTPNPNSAPGVPGTSSSYQQNTPPSSEPTQKPKAAGNKPAAPEKIPQPTESMPVPSYQSPNTNTNYCGVSWEDHTKNCPHSLPCPRGDECPAGQSCFTGSPCSVLNSPIEDDVESNVGNFCGTEWNMLMSMCKSATRCPIGNECAEGEFCYRDFVCDPPAMPTTTTTTSTVISTTTSTVLSFVNGGGSSENNPNIDHGATTNEPLVPSESCNICGNSQLDWSQRVDFEGSDISCGEFGWIFISNDVREGSDRCLNFRSQYFDKCCYADQTGYGCDLCNAGPNATWRVREDVPAVYEGVQMTCTDLSNKVGTRLDPSSEQCLYAQNRYFTQCCEAMDGETTPEDSFWYAPTLAPTRRPAPEFIWYADTVSSSASMMATLFSGWLCAWVQLAALFLLL